MVRRHALGAQGMAASMQMTGCFGRKDVNELGDSPKASDVTPFDCGAEYIAAG
jgi:hypothetical protein